MKEEMDANSNLPFTREQHPYYEKMGKVKCLETIKFSIMTHHGCWGECNFCAIGVHQGRTIRTRSEESILKEAKDFAQKRHEYDRHKELSVSTKSTLEDMTSMIAEGNLKSLKVVLKTDVHGTLEAIKSSISVLRNDEVKVNIISSGVGGITENDVELVNNSENCVLLGFDVRPTGAVRASAKQKGEHTQQHVLDLMGKPGKQTLVDFKEMYDKLNAEEGKQQFLTYYLIAAHPGCEEKDMHELKRFTSEELQMNPEQAQVFTPTPSTYSAVMYYTEMDPKTRKKIFVEKDTRRKEKQKEIVIKKENFRSSFAS